MHAPDDIREQLRGDLYAGMKAVNEASTSDELRRTLNAALGTLYSWREFERRLYNERNQLALRHLGSIGGGGQLIEALILWRDVAAHHPEQLVELRSYALFPGAQIYPSPWLYPGENLCIVDYEFAPPRVRDDARSDYFRDHIASHPLLPLLNKAAHHLERINE